MNKIILYLILSLSLIGLSFAGLGNFGNDANIIANSSSSVPNPIINQNGSRTLPIYYNNSTPNPIINSSNLKYINLLNNYKALEKRFTQLQLQNKNLQIMVNQLVLNLSGTKKIACNNLKENACISNSQCTPKYNILNGRKGSNKVFQSCESKKINQYKNVSLGTKPKVSINSNSVNINYYLINSITNKSIFYYYNPQNYSDFGANFTTYGNVNLGILNNNFKYQVSPGNNYKYVILSKSRTLYTGQFSVPQFKKNICNNLKENTCISNSQCTPKYNISNGRKGSNKVFQSCN